MRWLCSNAMSICGLYWHLNLHGLYTLWYFTETIVHFHSSLRCTLTVSNTTDVLHRHIPCRFQVVPIRSILQFVNIRNWQQFAKYKKNVLRLMINNHTCTSQNLVLHLHYLKKKNKTHATILIYIALQISNFWWAFIISWNCKRFFFVRVLYYHE